MKRTTHYYHRRAAEILEHIHYATLATVTDTGQPWNSPVAAMHDQQGRIY
jgi:general stress protein 26